MIENQGKSLNKLELLERALLESTTMQETVSALQKIQETLNNISQAQIVQFKGALLKLLKSVSLDVANVNINAVPDKLHLFQDLIFSVVNIYAKQVSSKADVAALELLQELLSRSSQLFKKGDQIENQEHMQIEKVQIQDELEWISVSPFSYQQNTFFYFKCLNSLLQTFSQSITILQHSSLSFIKLFIQYIYRIDHLIKVHKLNNFCEQMIVQFEKVVQSISKLQYRQIQTENIRQIANGSQKLVNKCKNNQLAKRFQMLPCLYANFLFNSTSIEKKINAVKIINKEAEEFYKTYDSANKQTQFIQWMMHNKILDSIFQLSFESHSLFKNCNYIFKILFKKKCYNTLTFDRVMQFLNEATQQNRLLLLKYLDSEIIRLQIEHYQIFLHKLKIPRRPQFYEQDLFVIANQIIRYSTKRTVQAFSSAILSILQNNYNKFKNDKIKYRCLKSYIKSIINLIEQETKFEDKKRILLECYDLHLKKQFTPFGIVIFKNLFEDLSESGDFSKCRSARIIIKSTTVIELGIVQMQRPEISKDFKQQIQDFLISLLRYGEGLYGDDRIEVNCQIMIETIHIPKLFLKLSAFIRNKQQLMQVFEKLLNRFQVQSIQFQLIKQIFQKINADFIIESRQANGPFELQVRCKVQSLIGVQNLKYLLLNTQKSQERDKIGEYLSDLYANFTQQRLQIGLIELQKILHSTMKMCFQQFNSKESVSRVCGYLSMVQNLMKQTQILGCGNYKPHNSLVPISTVQVKIENQMTYGNDVSPSYVKKVPANMTLFELLTDVSEKFRCFVCDISLCQGEYFWPQKLNGITLEELNVDGKFFKAVKSSKQKIRKQNLLENGQFTEKAKKIFQQIYHRFAVDGKMGKKQCSNFVCEVTKTQSSPQDNRVQDFFKKYDTDRDGNLTVQDFLQFYKHHSIGDDELVWKNLNNMRYRRDLKKFDDPIEIVHENLLFRAIIYKNVQFYNMLFALSESQNKQLEVRSKRLLLRLPTFQKIVEQTHSELHLISKNSFQTQYLLVAIQNKLNSGKQQEKQSAKKSFIECGNGIKIFQMMVRIDKNEHINVQQKRCMFISLQILRRLLKIPDLRNVIAADDFIQVNLNFPQTQIFQKIAKNALNNIEIDNLEAALTLKLTQHQNEFDLAFSGIFHEEPNIRRICCNYFFVMLVLGRCKINLFEIEKKKNCDYWFEMLVKVCEIMSDIDYNYIVNNSLLKIQGRVQSVQKNSEDFIIQGNLNIILSILKKATQKFTLNIVNQILQIAQNVTCSKNRLMIYQILAYYDIGLAITYIINLIENVEHVKQIQPKNCFVGLKNMGSTCYMNSVLQVLYCIDEFKSMIAALPNQEMVLTQVKGKTMFDNTLYQLKKMFSNFQHSKKKSYNPEQFCLTIKISTGEPINQKVQQDAHEFVGKFLDKIQKSFEKTNEASKFKQLFEGTTMTQILCRSCQNKILRQQTFSQLPLSVQRLQNLSQSLQKFISPQIIQDYGCQMCKKKSQQIQKSTYLSKLPKLLIINLQRMVYDLEDLIFKKIDTCFEFPQALDMKDYIIKESKQEQKNYEYNLKAIVIHSGNSESGHYYSIIKIQNEWYKFNDQSVTKFDFKDIVHEAFGGGSSQDTWGDQLKFSTNAYMLFYQKKQNSNQSQQIQQIEKIDQFKNSILKQNQKFYKQIQVHQQSIFQFAAQLYQKFEPSTVSQNMLSKCYQQNWFQDVNKTNYEMIYELHIKILKFSTVFTDINSTIIYRIAQNVFRLFYLLPQKSKQFLTELNPDECIDLLCLHNDQKYRQIYKCLLNKSLHVYISYNNFSFESEQPNNVKIITLIDTLYAFLQDSRFIKNFTKSFSYLDFWKVSCEYIPQITQYLVKHESLAIFLNLLIGANSPLVTNKNNVVDVSQNTAQTLLHLLAYLVIKKNGKGYATPNIMQQIQNYYYSSMAQPKRDNNVIVSPVMVPMTEQEQQISMQIAKVLLSEVNNLQNMQSARNTTSVKIQLIQQQNTMKQQKSDNKTNLQVINEQDYMIDQNSGTIACQICTVLNYPGMKYCSCCDAPLQ